jgi:hypothetical protein
MPLVVVLTIVNLVAVFWAGLARLVKVVYRIAFKVTNDILALDP